MAASPRRAKMECECCPDSGIVMCEERNGMMMCEGCINRQDSVTVMLADAVKVDDSIQVKTDIFNAATVAAIELKGLIAADERIPDSEKDYAFAQVCYDRFQKLQKVIFDARVELLARENELRMWQVQTQAAAGKLEAKYRDQFKAMDTNYQPTPVKVVKPKAVKAPSTNTAAHKQAVADAAKKYGILPSLISMTIAMNKSLSPDEAAQKVIASRQAVVASRTN